MRFTKLGILVMVCCFLLYMTNTVALAYSDNRMEAYYVLIEEQQEYDTSYADDDTLMLAVIYLTSLVQIENESAMAGQASLHLGRLLKDDAPEMSVDSFALAYQLGDIQCQAEALYELERLESMGVEVKEADSPRNLSDDIIASIYQEMLSSLPTGMFIDMSRREHGAVRVYVDMMRNTPWLLYEKPQEMRKYFQGYGENLFDYVSIGDEVYLEKLMECCRYLETIEAPTIWRADMYFMISEWYALAGNTEQEEEWWKKVVEVAENPDTYSESETNEILFPDTLPSDLFQ